jgi:hypothetical protein
MVLGIVSISVSLVVSVLYIITRLKTNCMWGVASGVFAVFSFIASAILVLFNATEAVNGVYIFILLGLVISLIGDMFIELKDDKNNKGAFLNLGMIVFAAHKILNFTALILLISNAVELVNFLIAGAIAVALTFIIIFTAKMLKLNFGYALIQVICYFLISTFIATVAIWYAFLIPALIMFSIAVLLFLFSDIALLKMHLGNREGKETFFVIHNIFYFLGHALVVAFLYFGLF